MVREDDLHVKEEAMLERDIERKNFFYNSDGCTERGE
jgi:hypothetical protein